MKNLKKVLALALAFAMSLTLFAGAAFTDDASIGVDYKDDVNMLVQLGVVGGYADGSFKPAGNITRAETTKLIYVLKYGYDDSGKLFSGSASTFTDVQNNANVTWAKGYINYCFNQGIVGGVGNNKFNPNGNVTVAELAKMLLVCLGADAIKEGYGGPNWASNVTADAMELGVFDGWTGDPTQPATRELACKLMRNTIFAPMYLYNAITGIGSQVNALDGKTENETLGEKTMGLKHVEGLVVSNPRYAINIDEEGKKLEKNASSQKDKSQVYYEVEKAADTDAIGNMEILTIEADLSDDLIGNKVDVYFKGDAAKNGTYSKVELLGDVLVNADTVAYDVLSSDIEIMPNGESNSKKEIKPYISFTTEDGEEKKVVGRTDYYVDSGVEKEVNNGTFRVANNSAYDGSIFAYRMFASNASIANIEDPDLLPVAYTVAAGATTVTNWRGFDKMGENELAKYRFISVDGGDTFSYIINMGAIKYTKVNTLTDSSITVSGSTGVKELGEEAEVIGKVTKGQNVIAYAKDGKLFVEPTEIVTGKATNFKDNTATINSKIYVADVSEIGSEIDAYFVGDPGANNENTQYTVYKNYILEIDAVSVAGAATDYAVILYSDFDTDTGVIKAKFGFADNTEATYEITRIANNDADNNALMSKFAANGMVGALVRVSVTNGMASLTANNVKDLYKKGAVTLKDDLGDDDPSNDVTTNVKANQSANEIANVVDGKFIITKAADSTYKNGDWKAPTYTYAGGANSIVYMVYGGKEISTGVYSALKAKAYKINGIADNLADGVKFKTNNWDAKYLGDAVTQVAANGMNTLVAGVMSVGETAIAGIADEDSIAYLLSAKSNYNTEANKWYMEVNMITAEGLVSTRTVDEVNFDGVNFSGNAVGEHVITPGSLVIYEMTAAEDGSDAEWINVISLNQNMGDKDEMIDKGAKATQANMASASGYYAVQVGVVDEEMIGFFPNTHIQDENTTKENWANGMITLDVDKYRFDVVAIDDTTFIEDGDVETISYSDEIASGDYNAILVVEGGEVVRVFSLYNNF